MPRKTQTGPLVVAPLGQRLMRFLRLDKHPLPCMARKQVQYDERVRREEAAERQIRTLRQQNHRLQQELLETRDIMETQGTLATQDTVAMRRAEIARERVWSLRREWAACKVDARKPHSPDDARKIAEKMAHLAPQLAEAHDTMVALNTEKEKEKDLSALDSRFAPTEIQPAGRTASSSSTSRRRSREFR